MKKIIYFKASWCNPCKMLSPIMVGLEDVEVDIIDVDSNEDLALSYGVKNVPTLLFLKDDEVKDKSVGFIPKEAVLKKYNEI